MSHISDSSALAVPKGERQVAALCVSGRSIYKHLPGVDCFDHRRDARQFAGQCPW